MKRNSLMTIPLALLLAACGLQAAPAIDPAQIQASAAAMAGTFVAETQAASPPTLPPTNTSVPSSTPLPLPTETPVPTVIEASPTPGDPCDKPFLENPVGAPDAGKINNGAKIFITNQTKASVTVSLFLSKNEYGQCGFVSYVLAPMQSETIVNVLPYGCYYAYAFVNDPKKPSRPSGGPACITGPDQTTFTVYADRIKVTGP